MKIMEVGMQDPGARCEVDLSRDLRFPGLSQS